MPPVSGDTRRSGECRRERETPAEHTGKYKDPAGQQDLPGLFILL